MKVWDFAEDEKNELEFWKKKLVFVHNFYGENTEKYIQDV